MSLRITVDEGAAFDMYSILRVKLSKLVSAPLLESVHLMQTEIKTAIGADRFGEILSSPQYQSLIETNARLFDLIDEIKRRGAQASDALAVDSLNYQRYQGKQAIQSTFFNTSLSEIKLGYEPILTSDTKPATISS